MFAALLDDTKGGRFCVCPAAAFDSIARYRPETNILETRFRTRAGGMTLVDFMPIPCGGDLELEEAHHELYRLIEVTSGKVDVRVVFEPRFDYARAEMRLQRAGAGVTEGWQLTT
jgi:GH15 family glucan-1,4-alpha-glucosidase